MTTGITPSKIAHLAVELEEASADFYRHLADIVSDPEVQNTFNLLSAQEAGHQMMFSSLAEKIKDETAVELLAEFPSMMARTLKDLKEKCQIAPLDIASALNVALEAEAGAVQIYSTLRLSVGEEYHQTLDDIIAIERDHARWIESLKARITKTL